MLEFLEALLWPLWPEKKEYPKPIEVPPGCIVLTSPYLDIHNDYIQLYYIEKDGMYHITDDGATISALEDSGLLNDRKGKELLGNLLMDNLLRRSGNELWLVVDRDDVDEMYKAFIDKLREITRAFEAYIQ